MVATATKKRVPNSNEMAFIQVAREILAKQVSEPEAIEQKVKGDWRDIAIELLIAIQEDGDKGFWDSYDASANDRPAMKDWRNRVEVEPEPVEQEAEPKKKERSYQLQPLSYFKNRPRPEWAVDKIVRTRGSSLFIGDGGSGKSALVLDLYLSRVCNVDFVGKAVKPTFLIWVAAESIDELYPRAAAYLASKGIPEERATDLLILDNRVPFNNTSEIDLFIQEVQEQLDEIAISPELPLSFVFDTYARCTPGSNENDTQETKIIAESILKIGAAFNAQVTTIHHMNAQGRIRGNTALRDAVDTAWNVVKEGENIKLHCDKMRGAAPPEDILVKMKSILLDPNDLDYTAPIIAAVDDHSGLDSFTPRIRIQMLELLRASGQLTSNTWAANCEKAHQIAYTTFNRHRAAMFEEGLIEYVGGKPEKGKRVYYTVSKKGEELLG